MRTGAEVVDGDLRAASGSAGVRTAGDDAASCDRAETGRPRRRRLVGRRRVAARGGPPAGAPGEGPDPELRGRDGEPPARHILASERVYLVPRADGRLIVGATVEELGFDTAVTAGGVHELLREAYRLLPDIAELELVEADRRPPPRHPGQPAAVGPGAIDGLVLATGHFRNGILLAPLAARAVADLLLDDRRSSFAAHTPAKDERRRRWRDEDRAQRRAARAAGRRHARRCGRAPRAPGEGGRGVAVALDGEVVPRGEWERTPLREGQAVEVLAAIQGGAEDGLGARRPRVGLAADRRHRRLPLAGADGGGAAAPPGPRSSPSPCAGSTPRPRARSST